MAIPSHPAQSGTFLITSATYNRRRLFQVAANADLFKATLQQYRRVGHYLLHEFVIMPEHIHLLITPKNTSLEKVMGRIKGGFSYKLKSKVPVWQKGYTDRRARDKEEFLAFRAYIRQNPVRARLSENEADYKWSSAWSGTLAEL